MKSPLHRLATVILLSSAAALAGEPGAAPPPNIVFILADDLGYGDLGCYGQKKFRTPNLDRLAEEGIRFTQFYAGSTVCAPSRCALITGRHTGHATVRGNRDQSGMALKDEDQTVAELLKKAGYATGAFGKWGLGSEKTSGAPWKQGFDEWYGYLLQQHAHRYNTDHLWKNGEKAAVDEGRDYSHDLIAEAALDFVRRHKAEPFFLYLAFTIPHAELRPPVGTLTDHRFPEKPFLNPAADRDPERRGYRSQSAPRAAFAAMVSRLDRDVGRLVALLGELGIDGRTAIFFSSDNGPHEEGGADPEFFQSSGPLRGIKRDLYEGGIRVPLIVRWPGKIRGPCISAHVAAMWDFLPTVAEMAGLEPPAGLDGISLLPVLLGRPGPRHEYLYWEFHERGFQQAARMEDWKGVRLGVGRPLELYDLQTDPGETRNVAARFPDVVRRLEKCLEDARTPSPDWLRRARF